MTKHSKYHLIIVLLTFGLLGILKGQGNGTYQMPIGRFDEKKVELKGISNVQITMKED